MTDSADDRHGPVRLPAPPGLGGVHDPPEQHGFCFFASPFEGPRWDAIGAILRLSGAPDTAETRVTVAEAMLESD